MFVVMGFSPSRVLRRGSRTRARPPARCLPAPLRASASPKPSRVVLSEPEPPLTFSLGRGFDGRMNRCSLLRASVALLTFPAAVRGQESAGPVLLSLRPEHPRLIATAEHDARLKALIADQPLARQYWEQIHAAAVDVLAEPTVVFEIVGPRLLAQSRRCLDRVYTLGTAYRLTGEQRFVARAVAELAAAADFPHWNPSHFLDTAELCHAFGIGYDWLYGALTPEQRQMIRGALVEKGLLPGRRSYEGTGEGYGGWVRSRHNWNQVCVGGVSIGALAVADEEPELCELLMREGLESIRNSMAQFAPDGGWNEGPGYWNYATRYNVCYLAALMTALGSDFGLSAMPGFSNTGAFRIQFCGPAGETFNYADAGSGIGRAPQMFWLAQRFDQPVYAWHERSMSGRPHPLDLWWFDARGAAPAAEGFPLDAVYRGIDVALARSSWEDPRALFVGFKGGDNRANHSHLDLGTFVLDAAGKRWALDLGADDYNMPGYFGAERWAYFRLRTEAHNTLVLNGENQDPAARAPIVAVHSTPRGAFAVADLSAAYARHAKRVWRGIAVLDRAQVLVHDEIDAEQPVELVWTMLTRAEAEVQDATTALLTLDGEQMTAMLLRPPAGARFEVMGAQPPPPQNPNTGVRRLVVSFPERVAPGRVVLSVLLRPGREQPVAPQAVPPLEGWADWDAF